MPFATADDGVRIHYEVEGEGQPLVLLHGFSRRLERWRETGYVDRLRNDFRLVLIDLRGFGESDKPTNREAYDNRQRVLDVGAVLTDAGIQRAHLFGYSMGAIVGMSAAIYQPQRFASFVLGGASPYGSKDLVMASMPFEDLWSRVSNAPGADHDAWQACVEETKRFGGAVQALKSTRVPVLLFAGDQDGARHDGSKRFSEEHGKTFFAVPGKDHENAFMDVDTVLPQVTQFLEQHPIA